MDARESPPDTANWAPTYQQYTKMPRSKKTETVVVRPIKRGADSPRKTVLAPLKELNRHAPLHELAPIFINNDPRPWHRQSRSPPKQSRWRSMPSTRTVGRTIGNEWVSADYVCGTAIEPEWGYEADAQEEREREWCEERQHPADEEGGRARAEVHIMDIAKPAKRRGPAKDYEVVQTVHRVIALDDDGWEQWDIESVDEMESEDWETLEDEAYNRASYATILQQTAG